VARLADWWTQDFFAGSAGAAARNRGTATRRIDRPSALACYGAWLVLLVVAGLLFFGRLGSPLLEPEEAMYAEIPREMRAAGNWMLPVHRGLPFYEKPPLLYWLVLASYGVFGVHEYSARLVTGAVALATVIVTFWWGNRTLGLRAGLAGALILCLSPRFVHQTRMISMDGLLCLSVIAGLAWGQLALKSGRLAWHWWLLSAAACGLGALTKGPVALVLVTVPLLGYQLLDQRTARPGVGRWLAYLGATTGLAVPWYAAMAWRDPAFVREFFWNHHINMRFVQPLHEEPAWFYLPILLLGMLPGTALLPSLVRYLARRSAPASRRRPGVLGFWLLSCSWCVLFFSVADCKRIGYILPAMPTLALALGYTLDRKLLLRGFVDRPHRRGGRATLLPFTTTMVIFLAGVGGALLAGSAGLLPPVTTWGVVALAITGMAYLVYRRRRTATAAWTTCGVATFVLLLLCIQCLLPGYYRRFSMRAQVQSILDRADHVPVVCYPHSWDSIHFYLQRDDVRSFRRDELAHLLAELHERPETLVFVKSGTALTDLLRGLPPSLEFVSQSQSRTVTAGLVRQRNALSRSFPRLDHVCGFGRCPAPRHYNSHPVR
jgi:4-amino-4-deoxy-L-arabinose transferase-like glycosyltransferase